eukprot:CAMPEP_0181290734 /NCGR_PEP_ID=MMETSP1101-20121128/1573_1 /TAXON_ID=46948 /ORGANISM="Rhodomonas abbreviata, Strain Caron Lab Isolate" /LENGTH=79 /DNA_ID=CAMNT_0023395041 /DNA_START=50 /DNA_END=289 /DNA_ORIENTATION=+
MPKFTPEQVEEIKGAFKDIDADGSGSITPDEFKASMEKEMGTLTADDKEELKMLLEKFDKDGDGKVSLTEFFAMIAAMG